MTLVKILQDALDGPGWLEDDIVHDQYPQQKDNSELKRILHFIKASHTRPDTSHPPALSDHLPLPTAPNSSPSSLSDTSPLVHQENNIFEAIESLMSASGSKPAPISPLALASTTSPSAATGPSHTIAVPRFEASDRGVTTAPPLTPSRGKHSLVDIGSQREGDDNRKSKRPKVGMSPESETRATSTSQRYGSGPEVVRGKGGESQESGDGSFSKEYSSSERTSLVGRMRMKNGDPRPSRRL